MYKNWLPVSKQNKSPDYRSLIPEANVKITHRTPPTLTTCVQESQLFNKNTTMYDPLNVKEQVQTKTRKLEILRNLEVRRKCFPIRCLRTGSQACTPSLAEHRVFPSLLVFHGIGDATQGRGHSKNTLYYWATHQPLTYFIKLISSWWKTSIKNEN